MKKKPLAIIILTIISILFSCNINEKKPFGAEDINYDIVEGINKEGPTVETSHVENIPPISDKTHIIENGPPILDLPEIKTEPTADMDIEPDYGGIPIVIKGTSNGS